MIYEEKKCGLLEYCVWKPNSFDENEKYPVIFFTHGAGSRGKDLALIKNHTVLRKILENAPNAIVVAPQCGANTWFDVFENLIFLGKEVYDLPYTDKSRFYGAGVSMGGYAALQLLQSQPSLFAAGIVCCGGGMYWNAERLKDIPLRLFHGAFDATVLPCESEHMAEAVNRCGGNAELTIYPDLDHNCWDRTFQNADNYAWLLSKQRKTMR